MNRVRNWICSSAGWKKIVANDVLPWALKGVTLGADVLEIGPGFGATTDVLHTLVDRLTCVEVNPALAEALTLRLSPRNVTVICQDATAMSLPDASFDSVVCFTMLHPIPSADLQDRLLREVARVLRPGGAFAGSDSRASLQKSSADRKKAFIP